MYLLTSWEFLLPYLDGKLQEGLFVDNFRFGSQYVTYVALCEDDCKIYWTSRNLFI
jgi:hypothetical protein